MSYPDRYCQFHPLPVAGTDNIAVALNKVRMNDLYGLMSMAYGGGIPERFWSPKTPHGPWARRFFYNLAGFTHAYTNADPDLEYDRVTAISGNLALAWNFQWHYLGAPTSAVKILNSYWYVSPFPIRVYRYLGRMNYAHAGGVLTGINWNDAAADPHPPPVLQNR